MPKGCVPEDGRTYFGIKEEHLTMALMAPLIFACMMTDPILVSVENFNNGQPWALLTYGGAENQSFEMNISRHVVRGNWSEDGVFRDFTLQLCPMGGSPSNLIMFFPETGNSTALHAGALTECVNVTVDTAGFDSYFATRTGTILNFRLLAGGGGPVPESMNFMMLRNPRIYDPGEEVYFTLLWPFAPADEVHYRCHPGDAVRTLDTPAVVWRQTLPVPPELIPLIWGGLPFHIPIVGDVVDMHSTIWDLPCPAYGAPGKYEGKVLKVHTYLENVTWPDYYEIDDHFNTSTFNDTIWEVHMLDGAIYPSAYADGRLVAGSPAAPTGIIVYYAENVTPGSEERFDITANISTAELQGGAGTDTAGIFGFMDGAHPPMDQLSITSHVSNIFVFNATDVMAMCDPMAGPIAMAPISPGYHIFRMNSTGNDVEFYLDGALMAGCYGADGISQTVYFFMSPDPLTDMWAGNISVEWANVTFDSWNGAAWERSGHYDDFDSLGPSWLILNNSITAFSGYDNDWTESMLRMYSYGGDISALVIYHAEPVIYAGSDASAMLVNATFDRSSFAGEGMAGLFLATQKSGPEGAASATSRMRGAIFLNDTDYLMFCDVSSGSPDVAGTFDPADPDLVVMSYDPSGGSFFAAGHDTLTTCSLSDETLYLGFTPDPFTDAFQGNISLDRIQIASFNLHPVTGWRWYDSESPVWGFAGSFGFPSLILVSDVIVRGCTDGWNCGYSFNISSDSAGSVNVSIVNITYENLLGYRAGVPTVTFTDSPLFSWAGSNSTVISSEVRYQTSLFDSRVERSHVILSDLHCTHAADSTIHAVIRLSEFRPELIDPGIPIAAIRFDPTPCGEIRGSTIRGGMFFGGSVYDSDISGGGGFLMDFYGVRLENYTLKEGIAVINFTRYGANVPQWLDDMGMDRDTFDVRDLAGGLPFAMPMGCHEGAVFAIEGFPTVALGNSPVPMECMLEVYDAHLVFDNMSTSGSIGGPAVSLMRNASFTIDNQSADFNMLVEGGGARLLFHGLSTAGGALTFSSGHHVLDSRLVSLDSGFYGWLDGTNVTIIFDDVRSFGGQVYHYDGFTDDPALVAANGTLCNESTFCHGIEYDPAARTLTLNATSFSSYSYLLQPSENGGESSRDRPMIAQADAGYVGEEAAFIASTPEGQPLSGVTFRIIGPDGFFLTSLETGADGTASFIPGVPGTYSFIASRTGYVRVDGEFQVSVRAQEQPAEPDCVTDADCSYDEVCTDGLCSKLQPGACGFFAAHRWIDYDCCEDADCGPGYVCTANSCILQEVPERSPEPEVPKVSPPADQVPPATASPEGIDAERVCCLGPVCAIFAGICWYWWILIGGFLLAALAGSMIYRKLGL